MEGSGYHGGEGGEGFHGGDGGKLISKVDQPAPLRTPGDS